MCGRFLCGPGEEWSEGGWSCDSVCVWGGGEWRSKEGEGVGGKDGVVMVCGGSGENGRWEGWQVRGG